MAHLLCIGTREEPPVLWPAPLCALAVPLLQPEAGNNTQWLSLTYGTNGITGIFACGFEDTQAVHPGLVVEGVGVVALPLQPEQAKVLQSCCQAAPFGRGQETLWDPAVAKDLAVGAFKNWFQQSWQVKPTNKDCTVAKRLVCQHVSPLLPHLGDNSSGTKPLVWSCCFWEQMPPLLCPSA